MSRSVSMNNSPLEPIAVHPGLDAGIALFIKRDDLLCPEIQGNKWRKIAPVIDLVRQKYPGGIVTFGGPFSNHLCAVAAAGRKFSIHTYGIVRGLHADLDNPTLRAASQDGMMLFRVSKPDYDACKDRGETLLGRDLDHFFILPEGGATPQGVGGCTEIASEIQTQLALQGLSKRRLFVCVPAGTGCTAAGIVAGLDWPDAHTLVFPVVNKGFEPDTVLRQVADTRLRSTNHRAALEQRLTLVPHYEFGGFAKMPQTLLDFVRAFRAQTGILLDPIYTSKMLFGVYDMLARHYFPAGSIVVAIHTGGLQGWKGFSFEF